MKIIFAPSIPWLPEQSNFIEGSCPNPLKFYELLRKYDIESVIVDPLPFPLNPFSGKNTLLQSIDPLRACQIALRERDVDVIVSVFEGAACSLGALRKFLSPNTSLVMWDIGLTNWKLRNKIINFTLPKIDTLLVLGHNQIDYIKNTYEKCTNISTIGHYVDSDFYHYTPINANGLVLSVGDDIGRNYPILLNAARTLNKKIIIKTNNRSLVSLSDNVEFLRSRISYLTLRELYENSSVVVVPTSTTPNASGVSSILEAAACGRPLVVTDNPGIHDFIIPNETCLMVPPNDAVALRNAILSLLANPGLAQKLANNARAFIEKNCTYQVFTKRFADTMHRIKGKK